MAAKGAATSMGPARGWASFSVDGNDITTVNLPLSFVRPLEDPRYALILDVPLTYSETNGSASAAASLGWGCACRSPRAGR